MTKPFEDPIPSRIRKGGMWQALGGLVAIGLLWPLGVMELLVRLANKPSGSLAWLGGCLLAGFLSAPFVLFCVGVLELATGRPFRRLSTAWNQMNEWKQGGLSFLLLWAGIGLVGLILYITARYFPEIWTFE